MYIIHIIIPMQVRKLQFRGEKKNFTGNVENTNLMNVLGGTKREL